MTTHPGRNGDSGNSDHGCCRLVVDHAQEQRVARALATTHRCAKCGYVVRHPEAEVLLEMAKEHAEGCK